MRSILAILISVLMASGAAADDRAYSGDVAGNLFLLNFTTGSKTPLGNLGAVGVIGSMTHDPATGLLYAVNTSGDFFHIVPSSATSTLITNLGVGDIEALDMIDGRLIGIDFSGSAAIYEIDPATGGLTPLSVTSIVISSAARSLAMASAGVGYVSDYDTLYSVDIDTGTTVLVGPLAISGQMHAMDFVNGTLYGVASTSGNFYKVDPGTGNTLFLGNFGVGEWYADLAPIEEPVGDWAYASTTAADLIAVNFTTVTETVLGSLGGQISGSLQSMAYDKDTGQLFGMTSQSNLYEIDPVLVQATLLGNAGLGNIEALDIVNGRLIGYLYSGNTAAYEFDRSNGSPTLLASIQVPFPSTVQSATMVNETTSLVHSSFDLHTFDITNGATSLIGTMSIPPYGMDFINGTLYGVSSGGALLQIDENTAFVNNLGSVGSQFFLSLAGVDTTLQPVSIFGELSTGSFTWDRIKDTGFIPGPCGTTTAFDSHNDGQPFDAYWLTAIDPSAPVVIEMHSREPPLAGFDPFLALYCDSFLSGTPLQNVFAVDDDSLDISKQDARIEITLSPAPDHVIVATSYASYAPARYGNYELFITNGTAVLVCVPDINRDGILDNGDIGDFIDLFISGNPAADMNGDGFLDNGDINTFIALFLAGC